LLAKVQLSIMLAVNFVERIHHNEAISFVGKIIMAGLSSEAEASSERTVKQITLLMPVWGYQFIGRFLEFCLPTLLAPNNIPALAQELPCRFVVLSSVADETMIRSHPAWQRLEQHCAAEIQPIDDLITQGNHTATITLAFERVVREAGDAIRDTCFIFLMSDYLFADGSLKTVLAAIRKGASCLLAGNFQIIAEDAVPILRQRFDPASHEIVLNPRDLMRWSLDHLHPATVANIVNFELTHNAHTNRLFWQVDEDTLIGRFYLMHPIAIHPEVTEFVVGSSWDYSFVPELCPSGNIVALTDSDEYLVVELQRRSYESENLRPGPIDPQKLAVSLSEWATENHRRNVEQTLVFHAADRPPNLPQVIAQSDAFVESVRQSLLSPALFHRQHPYWVGSIAVNRRRSNRPLSKTDWSFLLSEKASDASSLQRMQAKLFGSPPDLTRLHPLWPDYKSPLKAINDVLSAKGRVLLVVPDSEAFAQWVVRAPGEVVTLNSDHLLQLTRVQYTQLAGTFDACLLLSGEGMLEQSDELIEHVAPLLKAKGQIIMMVANNRPLSGATEFSRIFATQAGRLLSRSVWIEDIQYVELSPRRLAIRRSMMRLASIARRLPLFAPAVAPIALATYFANLATRTSSTPPLGAWSSVCLTLRAPGQDSPYPRRFAREATLNRDTLVSHRQTPVPAGALQEQLALPMTEIQANPLWQDDAAQLASTLACYRFVVALMGARHDVAEYGCASPLGTRLILQQFRKFTLFDPRQPAIDNLAWHFRNNWRFEAWLHNILSARLPRAVDSAFSVDFIQYISRDEEETFVRNLRDSLHRDFDFLLIGSPSYGGPLGLAEKLEAAQDSTGAAAPTHIKVQSDQPTLRSQTGRQQSGFVNQTIQAESLETRDQGSLFDETRIYRRTAAELKALMERFFHSVFIFSMVDGIAQPGTYPNAKHIFALGCGKK
jgi:hypothetical protein